MIEQCFKCKGEGAVLIWDMPPQTGGISYGKTVSCDRCKGAGALVYTLVTTSPVTMEPLPDETI